MIDRFFSTALTFIVLIAGTLALGAALFGNAGGAPTPIAPIASAQPAVVQLETVVITGKRIPASTAWVAKGDESAPRRVQ